jgi:predicted acylesterase/phospholipase RssA
MPRQCYVAASLGALSPHRDTLGAIAAFARTWRAHNEFMASKGRTAATSGRTPGRIPPDPTGGKRALVLCGGGITGVTYEIGALRALDDLLVGISVNDFDIYVGTSAGSWVASLLVNGVSPTDMALSLEGTSDMLAAPSRWTIYRPNVGEMASRLLRLPQLTRDIVWEMARNPGNLNPLDAIGMLLPLLPSSPVR